MPMTRAEVERFYALLAEATPIPKGELEYINPYTLLVAVVLSAQATDVSVNKATAPLFKRADTPQKMVALGEQALSGTIKSIGLYRTKAKNVIALSKLLIEQHGGAVPRDRAALEALPGVGRKTANVVLNIAFGEPTIAVDTHIFRVGNRTGLAPGKTPRDVEDKLVKITPAAYARNAHHWLILHGRYVCKARRPECWRCVVAEVCRFKGKETGGIEPPAVAQAGRRKPSPAVPRVRGTAPSPARTGEGKKRTSSSKARARAKRPRTPAP